MGLEYARRAADPAISVVIPTIPGYDHRTPLASFDGQSIDEPYEMLVVNDGTLDRSEARNEGLRAATADVVALTDDDTKPPADWLANIHREFRADPDLVCLEGPVFGGCRSVGPRRYVGCNLAVRRGAALAVGGFRSEFSEWREDVEFGWRMEAEAEGVCRYSEDVRMCHPTAPRTAFKPELERQLREEYPHRYAEVLNASATRRLYRRARALGLTQPVHRAINALRRLFGDPRVSADVPQYTDPNDSTGRVDDSTPE
ncbi:glycosyltransferase family 2 protein [Halobacteriales archaeon SW_10_68_16]|jgi:GT2 family glycosyltransferase|nr:MAG: glycosyltransferase family 2 protein [Halobacteriales archaeon SW_10_68_16]